jgi:hypothetical protein
MLTVLVAAACAAGEQLADDALGPLRDGGIGTTVSQGVGQGSAAGGASTADGVGGGGASVAAGGTTSGMGDVGAAAGGNAQGSGGASMTGSGGAAAGRSGNGGATISDGGVASDAVTACGMEQKVCNGQCVVPSVSVGCGLLGCAPCPVGPSNSAPRCTGSQCDFECSPGYARNGGTCVANEGGAGDASTTSDAGSVICGGSVCGGCMPFIQESCCKTNNTCGCHYPFAPCM